MLKSLKYKTIKNILSENEINIILDGKCEWNKPVSSRRTIKKVYHGCKNLTDYDLNFFKFVQLKDGRVDINLDKDLSKNLIPEETQKTILHNFPKGFEIVHTNLLINPPNENIQDFHQDNSGVDADNYYTLLIPLIDEDGMGKTEIVVPYSYNFPKKPKTIIPDVTIGDGLIFSGCLWHRGTANLSKYTRYCIYMIISNADKSMLFEDWK